MKLNVSPIDQRPIRKLGLVLRALLEDIKRTESMTIRAILSYEYLLYPDVLVKYDRSNFSKASRLPVLLGSR